MVVPLFIGVVIASLALFLTVRGLFATQYARVERSLVASPVKSLAAGVGTGLAVFGLFVGLNVTGVAPLGLLAAVVA